MQVTVQIRTPKGCHIIAQGATPGLENGKCNNPAPRWGVGGWVGVRIPRITPWAMMLDAVGVPEMISQRTATVLPE